MSLVIKTQGRMISCVSMCSWEVALVFFTPSQDFTPAWMRSHKSGVVNNPGQG
jgi:hypothetical protein